VGAFVSSTMTGGGAGLSISPPYFTAPLSSPDT
jgi:hypothetical protein